jgi:hypothetical protein
MVEEEHLTYAEAASVVTIDQWMISRWRKQEDALGAIKRPGALQLHSGPHSILMGIESDLLDFVDAWHGKGLLVNHMVLV